MTQALLFGLISSSALVLGAVVGLYFNFKKITLAAAMALGSGVLICALTFGLMEVAYHKAGLLAAAGGFLSGGTVFLVGNYLISIWGGRRHRRLQPIKALKSADQGESILLGAVLDGVPEAVALGISLFAGGGQGLLLLAALFLSNFPESLSSIVGLKREGFTKKKILFMWGAVALSTALIVVLSYLLLNSLDFKFIGLIEAFAAGAILAMISDTMIPEAYEEGGPIIGLLTVAGFLVSFVLSRY